MSVNGDCHRLLLISDEKSEYPKRMRERPAHLQSQSLTNLASNNVGDIHFKAAAADGNWNAGLHI
jgi:hypothetical protein